MFWGPAMSIGEISIQALVPLELSGTVQAGRYVVRFGCRSVRLPYARFRALVDLVLARLTSATGLTMLPSVPRQKNLRHQTLYRLRQDLDEALGAGAGALLVLHGNLSSYFLGLPAEHIVIDTSLRELAPEHLAADVVERLCAAGLWRPPLVSAQ